MDIQTALNNLEVMRKKYVGTGQEVDIARESLVLIAKFINENMKEEDGEHEAV